jgi:hypothetical protein
MPVVLPLFRASRPQLPKGLMEKSAPENGHFFLNSVENEVMVGEN